MATKHIVELTAIQAEHLEKAGLIHVVQASVLEYQYKPGPGALWREEHNPRTVWVTPGWKHGELVTARADRTDFPNHGEWVNVVTLGPVGEVPVHKGQVLHRDPEGSFVKVRIKDLQR